MRECDFCGAYAESVDRHDFACPTRREEFDQLMLKVRHDFNAWKENHE